MKSDDKIYRLQFDFTRLSLDQFDQLKRVIGVKTRAQVVHQALTLFYNAVKIQQNGGCFVLREKDGNLHAYLIPGVSNDEMLP